MASSTTTLPIERYIKSTVTIDDRAPAAASLQTIMLLTRETLGGPGGTASPVDAVNRVATYTTIDEVAAAWDATTSVYKAALAAYSQSPTPQQIKVGFIAGNTAAELDAVNECDSSPYGYILPEFADGGAATTLASWFEAREKVLIMRSNNALTKDNSDTGNIAEQIKQGGYNRTMVVYHDDFQQFPDAAFLAVALANDFDQADSAYTGKFKELAGITPVQMTTNEVQAVTGYVPQSGLDATQGHFANTYVNIGGEPVFVEGNMGSGTFFDLVHFADWVKIRVEEELRNMFLRSGRIPYTQAGLTIAATRVSSVLRAGQASGMIAADELNSDTGELVPGYQITVPNVFNASSSQRANRVMPCIQYEFRFAGAFHSACATGAGTVFNIAA